MTAPILDSASESQVAQENRRRLRDRGILTIALLGPPGSGKTSLIEGIARRLSGKLRVGAVLADITCPRTFDRVAAACEQVARARTTDLDALQVAEALDHLQLDHLDVLFLECDGSIPRPLRLDVGEDQRAAVFSAGGGDDKPQENPRLVADASLVLLAKSDLLPHVPFDEEAFVEDVRRLNAGVHVLRVSVVEPGALDELASWISNRRKALLSRMSTDSTQCLQDEWFFG